MRSFIVGRRIRCVAETSKGILIVDDAALVRLYYRSALERAGYRVEEAMNGIEAMERVLVSPFHLLVLDVNMPHMDGLTFLKRLRAHGGAESAIPVLMTSTERKAQDIAAATVAGANYYLVKPVGEKTLLAHVEMLCGPP